MTDLIKRIDDALERFGMSTEEWDLLADCYAEIHRLTELSETLEGQCDYFQAEIKRLEALREYAPMTDGEVDMFLYSNFSEDRITLDDYRLIEAEVIKRAGLRVKEKE